MEFRLKDSDELIACVWSFLGKDHICHLILGLNYDYNESHHLYKQIMYRMVKRGNDLEKSKIYLGLTADYEKQKYGAKSVALLGYIKVDDMYNLDLLSSLSG